MDEFNSIFLFYRGVDNVDDLMAEIAEQQELAYEISDAISKPYGFNEEFDEVRIHQEVLTVSQIKSVVAALHTAWWLVCTWRHFPVIPQHAMQVEGRKWYSTESDQTDVLCRVWLLHWIQVRHQQEFWSNAQDCS